MGWCPLIGAFTLECHLSVVVIGLWYVWLAGTAKNTDNECWPAQRIRLFIWDSLLNYWRMDWKRTLNAFRKIRREAQIQDTLKSFDSKWMTREIFGSRIGLTVRWNSLPPGGVIPNLVSFVTFRSLSGSPPWTSVRSDEVVFSSLAMKIVHLRMQL